MAEELGRHRGGCLVVSGINDPSVQTVVHALNQFLGNIGKTVDLHQRSFQRESDDQSMVELTEQWERGEVHRLCYGVNPGYDHVDAERFLRALEKAQLSVSLSERGRRDQSPRRCDLPGSSLSGILGRR